MTSITKGKFITIEGVDGSGKTTNVPILAEHLRSRGYKVLTTREPGGNPVGDQIRNILLHEKMDPLTELMLFLAARNEHVKKQVIPHLEAGYIVITDRFSISTVCYQGYGRGLLSELNQLAPFINGGLVPDYTLFFDLPYEESIRRLSLRLGKQDRLDLEEEDFKRRVYDGMQACFLKPDEVTSVRLSNNMIRIDALPELDVVAANVKSWANATFENLG